MAKRERLLSFILYAAIAAGCIWLAVRFVFPWALPFLLALLTARLMEPGVLFLMRKIHVRRSFASVVCSIGILLVISLLLTLAVNQILSGIGSLARNLPDMVSQMGHLFSRLEFALYRFVIAAPVETQSMIQTAIDGVAAAAEELPGTLSAMLLGFAADAAGAFPRLFLFILTYAISVLFINLSYPQVIAFLLRQIPAKWHERVRSLQQDLRQTLVKWLRAQLMLVSVTFVLLTLSFLILRVPYGILLAALIALIDTLPILGTGTVLIPWALLSFLGGDVQLSIGLILTYGVVSITHSVMEPRFVGRQLGLHPLATLMAMYLGYRLIGVLGMIIFPLGFILLKQFHDQGYVRLWR